MIKKTIYVAFDGTEFENGDECKMYEKQSDFDERCIFLWDEYGNEIENFSPDIFDDICFIYVGGEEDRTFLNHNFPYSIEWDIGKFYFMSKKEQGFISTSYYQKKYIEGRYDDAMMIKESEGL